MTDRIIRERQIQSLNVRLETIINSSPLAIIIIDTDGVVTLWNPAAERIFGWTEQETLARPLAIVPEDGKDEFNKILNILRQGRPVVAFSARCLARTGQLIDVSLSASPVIGADGSVISYLGMFEDITERKRLEADLLTAQKLETVGLLAGGIADDFNNTLNVICGNIELAKMLGVEGVIAERLTDAEVACDKAKELSSRLITFSKGGSPVLESHALSEIINETLHIVAKPQGISIKVSPMSDFTVKADRRQIQQVLRSLIINALEAMPEGGVLRIEAQDFMLGENEIPPLPEGPYLRISVKDEGVGISPEDLPRIFDPYFSRKQRFSDRGMGLGLAVCWSIIRKHGGAITVESAVGSGTVFHVYIKSV